MLMNQRKIDFVKRQIFLHAVSPQALRVCCQDMFFSRSRNTPSAQSLLSTQSDTRPVLQETLTGLKHAEDKMNVIGELIDLKVDTPTGADYSSQVCLSLG